MTVTLDDDNSSVVVGTHHIKGRGDCVSLTVEVGSSELEITLTPEEAQVIGYALAAIAREETI